MKLSPDQKLVSRFLVHLGKTHGLDQHREVRRTLGAMAQQPMDYWSAEELKKFHHIIDGLELEGVNCDLLFQAEIVSAAGGSV